MKSLEDDEASSHDGEASPALGEGQGPKVGVLAAPIHKNSRCGDVAPTFLCVFDRQAPLTLTPSHTLLGCSRMCACQNTDAPRESSRRQIGQTSAS